MSVGPLSKQAFKEHWPFGVVVVAVVVSRLWFAMTYPVVQISDYGAYYDEARGVAGLGSFNFSALNASGPKFLFGAWFRLVGDGLRGIGVLNTAMYIAALGLVYAGTCRAFGRATALIASIVAFFSLSEVYFINLVATEVPGALFIAAIYFLLCLGPLTSRTVVWMGIVGGLSVYNRSNMLPVGALVFAHELLLRSGFKASLVKSVAVQVITLIVTLPLCYFNLTHFGRFTPLIANAQQIWVGNNPTLSGDFHKAADIPEDFPIGSKQREDLRRAYANFYVNPIPDQEVSKMNGYDAGDIRVRYGFAWIAHNRERYLHLTVARFQFLFFSCTYGEVPFRYYDPQNPNQPWWEPAHQRLMERARLPVRSLYQFLIAGAFAGLVLSVIWDRPVAFLRSTHGTSLLIIAFYSLPLILTVAANRYHIPILVIAWVYLAHGLVLLGQMFKRLGSRQRVQAA